MHTLASISHSRVNKLAVVLSNMPCLQSWLRVSRDWPVTVGVSAFRTELTARAQLVQRQSRLWRHLSSHSQGITGPQPRCRDALHSHQHADPTGVYISHINNSCPAFTEALLGLEIAGFVYLASAAPSVLLISHSCHLNLIFIWRPLIFCMHRKTDEPP